MFRSLGKGKKGGAQKDEIFDFCLRTETKANKPNQKQKVGVVPNKSEQTLFNGTAFRFHKVQKKIKEKRESKMAGEEDVQDHIQKAEKLRARVRMKEKQLHTHVESPRSESTLQ